MQVVVNSLMTSYLLVGDKAHATDQPLLLLHGWGDSSASWREFAGLLSDGAGRQVCIIDLPGFGGTQAPPIAWGLDEYAGFIKDFLRKTGIVPSAIAGHSNGGAIAIRGLANGSLQADKLVLLASAGVRGQHRQRNKAVSLVAKTGKILAAPLPGALKDKLRRKLYTAVGSDMLVAEHLQESFKRVVGDDVRIDAAKLALPTLLIYGEHDTATPPGHGRILHEAIKGSTFEVLDAGHFVHTDQPQKVSQLVGGFLR